MLFKILSQIENLTVLNSIPFYEFQNGFFLTNADWLADSTNQKSVIGGTTLDCSIWLTHIRVQHLVLQHPNLECNIWSRVEPHQTATLHMQNYINVTFAIEPHDCPQNTKVN